MNSNFGKRIDRFFSNCFIITISIVSIFLVTEFLFRQFTAFVPLKYSHEINDQIHVPRPYVEAVASQNVKGVNRLGYRTPMPVVPKPKGDFRIFLLGGSTVFGHDSAYQDSTGFMSLGHYLNIEIQKKYGPTVKVFNFGITSTVAQQELARVIMDVVSFQPDLIVSYGGGNNYHLGHSPGIGYPHRYIFHEVNPLWITNPDEYPLFQLVALGSQVLRTFFRSYLENFFLQKSAKKPLQIDSIPMYSSIESNYAESIYRMEKVSNAFDSDFVAYLQPIKAFYFGTENETDRAIQFATQTSKMISDLGVKKFYSLKDLFKNEPESIWEDFIHLYDPANQKLAQWLANDLMKHIPLEPKPN